MVIFVNIVFMDISLRNMRILKLNKFTALAGLLLSISSLLGVIIMLDKRWAYAEDLIKLEQRLDYKICVDQRNGIQYRVWRLEDRYKTIGKMNQLAREEYRQLKRQLDDLECENTILLQPS